MSDKKPPEGLDDFLADMDPQSAMAAQGLTQTAALVAQQPAVQQAMDFTGNLKGYNDMVMRAIEGDEEAKKDLAAHSTGVAIGSLGKVEPAAEELVASTARQSLPGGAMERIHKILGIEQNPQGFTDKLQAARNLSAKAEEASKAGKLTQQDMQFVRQHAQKAENSVGVNKPTPPKEKYAKGGRVPSASDAYAAPVPKVPVSALPVDAPEGLDQFLGSGSQGSATPRGEPEGLDDFIGAEMKQEKYGAPGQQLKAGLEGAAQGLIGPFAPAIEKSLGVKEEDILARQEANPVTHYGAEIAGLVGPAIVSGGSSGLLSGAAKFTQHGALEAVGKLLPGAGETLASKIGATGAKAAIDNMLITGSDEASKLILNDPTQSAQTAIANVGLSGALGGALGGAAGAVPSLWKATIGDKASKFAHDFKARINEHMSEVDPVTAIKGELGDYYTKVLGTHDEVYGPKELPIEDIAKSVPEKLSPKMTEQADSISRSLEKSLNKMTQRVDSYPPRLATKLQDDLGAYQSAISKENATPSDLFHATQDLKQTLQGYGKFDKFVKPTDEAYDFVRDSQKLAQELRSHLEDSSVWGDAAKRQIKVNEAYKAFQPALKDFEKKFTTELAGERTIDPGKINTYVNQLGKPNAEIKQSVLKNFLEASEKYKKIVAGTHGSVDTEAPELNTALNRTIATLGEKTPGAKLADAVIRKGLNDATGKLAGGAVGGGIGELVGGHHGAVLGSILGSHALGPFFNSVLPGIAKALVNGIPDGIALKSSIDYGMAVAKGESALAKASKNLFKSGSAILSENEYPSQKDTAKLDKMLRSIQSNPEKLFNQSTKNNYLPEHGQALDQTNASAVTYLNSLRTDLDKRAPLDTKPVGSTTQKAAYSNALSIAEQPLIVMDKIHKGTLTAQDISTLGNVYPDLYNRMKDKITAEMVDAINKGKLIPYKTRIGISMFLAQPMDSTMSPMYIQAAQSANANSGPSESQQAPTSGESSKGVKSAPALQKMPGLYQTSNQSRQLRQNKQ